MPASALKPAKVGWLQAWSGRYVRSPSVIILIVANLVPLYGVLFWGWDLFTLMAAYWLETGVIGFWAILHMALVARWWALYLVPFFVVHFGGFMTGHFLFLWTIFASEGERERISDVNDFVQVLLWGKGLWLALAALFISHGLSFVINVLRPWLRGDLEQTREAQSVMMAPYGRVIVMHITILFGAMLAAVFKTKVAAFVLLIALKIFIDVTAHVRKNFKPDDAYSRQTSVA